MATNIFYDKEFRTKVRHSDKETLAKLMSDSMSMDARIKVLTNTKSTTYFVIPVNASGVDKQLQFIQAAGEELSTIASSGTVGSVCTCASSLGTLSTAGSVETG